MPLPCSPVSMSTGDDTSTSQSQSAAEDSDQSESDLITPRPGPSAPEHRTQAALSRPAQPTLDAFNRPNSFKEWKTDNIRERLELTDEEDILGHVLEDSDSISPAASGLSTGPASHTSSNPPKGKSQHTSAASPQLRFSTIYTVASSNPGDPASPTISSNPSSSTRPARARTSSVLSQKLKELKAKTTAVSLPALPKPTEPDRTRSVSFHPSSYSRGQPMDSTPALSPSTAGPGPLAFGRKASPRGSFLDSRHLVEETESSADENTAIFRRSSAKMVSSNNYGTSRPTEPADGYDGAGEEEPPPPAPDRPRKPKPSPAEDPSDSPPSPTRWQRLAEKYGSIELENKGSVARDHLALERTFLAWLRTSLSFASIGIAVTQLFRLSTSLQSRTQASPEGNVVATLGWPSSTGELMTSDFLTALASSPDFKRLSAVGKPLGATFLAVSILILFVGFHRYFEAQHYVIRGKFPASRGSVVLVSAVAGALIVASFAVVLGLAPGAGDTG